MTDPIEKPQRNAGGANRKKAVVVGLACVGMVAAIVAMNSDRLAAHSAVSEPTGQEVAASHTANTAPAVLSLTPATDRLEPLDVCQLACEASDDDGDVLTYTWAASQGDITGEGATVEWHAPDTEGLFRVSVTVDDGLGGTDEYSVSLRVQNNFAPEIQSVSSFAEGVRPGGSVSVSCSALDADGDEITYEWHSVYGEVLGEGESIVWVAPEKLGSYVITVSAHDAYGGEAKRDVLISVTPSLTPRLGEFVVEAIGHDLLKFEAGAWDTYLGTSYSIECIVAEGDEPFTYSWSADEGTLTSDGAVATWEAPDEPGPATIIVAVTDVHGNTNSGQVLMFVEDCTCVFG